MSRTKILVAVAAVGLVLLLLARGEQPSSRIQVLRDDPMAAYAPPGGTLVDTESQNERRSAGEPLPATYTRVFQLDSDAARALEHARSEARATGWKPFGEAARETFVGSKRGPSGRIVLILTLVENPRLLPEGVEPPALSISLRHLGG